MFRAILLIALLASLGAALLYRRGRPQFSFDAEKKAASLSDSDLKGLVDRLFVDDDPGRENFHTLLAAGKRADKYLVQVLDEPRTRMSVFVRTHFDFTGNSPFHRICDLLSSTRPPEAAAPLAKYLDHENREFREDTGSTLARIGTPECVEPVKRALADSDRNVRAHTLIGIGAGMRDHRQSDAFLNGLFPVVAEMLKDGKGGYDTVSPAEVLAGIDVERAAPLLESREYFTTNNPQLRQVLRALDSGKHKTPHAILMPLMKELAPVAASNGRRSLEFAAALRLYARNPDADAEPTFRALLDASNDSVALGAAGALEILAGIDPDEAIKAGDHGKFASMTVPQRYYYAVAVYHNEVCNGGHQQYFGNSSGDIYPTALEGLRAMGAKSKAAILESALAVFPAGRAATDRTERQDQMDRLSGLAEVTLRGLDAKYYETEKKPGERIEVLMALFALNYRADFLGKKP